MEQRERRGVTMAIIDTHSILSLSLYVFLLLILFFSLYPACVMHGHII